ncbi:MAG: alpha/beta hydrolase [Lachnospiraceae bacterium]|nr:alpha/beta hydrolase [Lachnospiraceae bacterium]
MKSKLKKIGILSILVTITLYIINRAIYSITTVKEILKGKENKYYEWRFGKIRYTVAGTGKPVLLIHDLTPGSSGYEFYKITDELTTTNQVFVIDLLGYGLSDKINITYTNFLYVQLISDFIKNVIGKKTDVITSGDSSTIAIMACHNNPDLIDKMIFINPQDISKLNQIPSNGTKILKLLIEFPILGTFVYNLLTNKTSITKSFINEYFYNKDLVRIGDIEAYTEAAHSKDFHSKYAISSYIGRYTNINILHALKEIDYSMFIIEGKEENKSEEIPVGYLNYNHAIEVSYIKETKHLPHLEKPEEVINHIKMYMS